jgi:hypothetical protein
MSQSTGMSPTPARPIQVDRIRQVFERRGFVRDRPLLGLLGRAAGAQLQPAGARVTAKGIASTRWVLRRVILTFVALAVLMGATPMRDKLSWAGRPGPAIEVSVHHADDRETDAGASLDDREHDVAPAAALARTSVDRVVTTRGRPVWIVALGAADVLDAKLVRPPRPRLVA